MVFMSVMGYTIGKLDDVDSRFNHSFTSVTNSISSLETSVDFIKDDIGEIKDILRGI